VSRLVAHYVLTIALFFSTIHATAQNRGTSYCSPSSLAGGVYKQGLLFARGVQSIPRNSVRPDNLKWELPVAGATGILIAEGDTWATNRIQSLPIQNNASRWSNVGLGIELASAGVAWVAGCKKHSERLSSAGFKTLDAMGMALAADLVLKAAFNREYPTTNRGAGEFWEGGKSFPSGHSAVSFAFASALAHQYPEKRWLKWSAYALATGVSLSRLPAKKHFPSDVLIGGTLGYVTGAYLGGH
jgi:membrane-associated phospholipid phosphatase